MAKDDAIAKFVYNTVPPTYQSARFIDWIKPYLEIQRQETERSNSYNSYFKAKYQSILQSLIFWEKFQDKVKIYQEEE